MSCVKMGSLGIGNTLVDTINNNSDKVTKLNKKKSIDSFINSFNLKDLEIPAKNGFNGNIFTDDVKEVLVKDVKEIVVKDVSDCGCSVLELSASDAALDVTGDNSSLSEMLQTLTLDLGRSGLMLKGSVSQDEGDRGVMSLVDYCFSEDRQSAEDTKLINEGNSLSDLLESFTGTDRGNCNLKDLKIPVKNGFKRDIFTDGVEKILVQDVSDGGCSILELGASDATTDVAQDSSLSEVFQSVTSDLSCNDLALNGCISQDDIIDCFLSKDRQSAEDTETTCRSNSLSDLFESFTGTDLCSFNLKDLEIPVNNGFNNGIFTDSVCTEKVFVGDASDVDHSIASELSASSNTTTDIAQDSSLSEMLQSLTLDLGSNDLTVNSDISLNDSDQGMMSLVDYYFSEHKQSAKDKELTDAGNSLADLLGSFTETDLNVSASENSLLGKSVLNSLCVDGFNKDSEVTFDKSCEEAGEFDAVDGDKMNFSLADLYYNGKCVERKFSDDYHQKDIQITTDNIDISALSGTIDSELSDNEKFSSCEDFIDDDVDLCSTLKPIDNIAQGYRHPNFSNYTSLKKTELIKGRKSLFCKVLCAKLKKRDLSNVSKHALNLYELVGEMDYNKYFSFDSPSPDDVVREKQKNALI